MKTVSLPLLIGVPAFDCSEYLSTKKMLLAAGANPNTKGLVQGSEHGLKFGTALDAAVEQKDDELIRIIREAQKKDLARKGAKAQS
jgi:hypothetical protein